MVRRLDVFLYQVGLHGNEKVTCCTMGSFHLPHEVLHTEIYTDVSNNCNEWTSIFFFLNLRHNCKLLLTPGEVLLLVHLADGSTVVFQLVNPLLCLLELVLQILLQKQKQSFY